MRSTSPFFTRNGWFAAGFAALTLCAGSSGALAQSGSGCTIYDGRDFRGASREFASNQFARDLGRDWNDRLTSVRVAQNCRLVTWEDENFEGDRRTFSENTRWAESYWERRASSAQCLCDSQRTDSGGTGGSVGGNNSGGSTAVGNVRGNDVCAIYRDPGLRGPSVTVQTDARRRALGGDLAGTGSSLYVPPSCEMTVFTREDGRGENTVFEGGSYSRLGRDWDNRIRAAECRCGAGSGGSPAGNSNSGGSDQAAAPASAMSCVVYTDADLKGRGVGLRAETRGRLAGSVVDGRIGSVSVVDGCTLSLEDARGQVRRFDRDANEVRDRWSRDAQIASCSCGRVDTTNTTGSTNNQSGQDNQNASREIVDACEVYADREFAGRRLTVPSGGGFRALGRIDNKISSLRVGEGCTLEVYENANFNSQRAGFRGAYRSDVQRLTNRMDDKISSIACRCDRAGGGQSSNTNNTNNTGNTGNTGNSGGSSSSNQSAGATGANMMCALFDQAGLSGRSLEMTGNTGFRTLGESWASRVTSVKVEQNCELSLYRDENYRDTRPQIVRPGSYNLPASLAGNVRSVQCACR